MVYITMVVHLNITKRTHLSFRIIFSFSKFICKKVSGTPSFYIPYPDKIEWILASSLHAREFWSSRRICLMWNAHAFSCKLDSRLFCCFSIHLDCLTDITLSTFPFLITKYTIFLIHNSHHHYIQSSNKKKLYYDVG